MRPVARPATASSARRIGAPPARTRPVGQVGSVHEASVGAKQFEFGEQGLAADDVDGAPPTRTSEADHNSSDGGVRGVLQDPIARLQVDEVGQQEQGGRRVDANHRGLPEVDAGRQRHHVLAPHPAPLRPVLPLQVDDQVARRDVRNALAGGEHPPDALRTGRGGQGRLERIGACAEQDVRRVDREGQHLEGDLPGARRAHIRRLDAARHPLRFTVGGYLHPLHRAGSCIGVRAGVLGAAPRRGRLPSSRFGLAATPPFERGLGAAVIDPRA